LLALKGQFVFSILGNVRGTTMIHIKEKTLNDQWVEISLDGILDEEAVPVVEEVCRNYLSWNKQVQLNLGGLLHVSRDGRDLLFSLNELVSIVNPPEFVMFP